MRLGEAAEAFDLLSIADSTPAIKKNHWRSSVHQNKLLAALRPSNRIADITPTIKPSALKQVGAVRLGEAAEAFDLLSLAGECAGRAARAEVPSAILFDRRSAVSNSV